MSPFVTRSRRPDASLRHSWPARRVVSSASAKVVISEVYGGGGNGEAPPTRTTSSSSSTGDSVRPVDLTGWSVQYGISTTGNIGGQRHVRSRPLSGSIAAGQYVLIQEAQGAGGLNSLACADITDPTPIAMAGTGGKVALVNTTTGLNCGATATVALRTRPASRATIVDLVGYGSGDHLSKAAAPTAAERRTRHPSSRAGTPSGCTDTDNNAADFTVGSRRTRRTARCCRTARPVTPRPTRLLDHARERRGGGAARLEHHGHLQRARERHRRLVHDLVRDERLRTRRRSAGGPTTYTLDPDTDFASERELHGHRSSRAQVTDQDTNDPPDAMAAEPLVHVRDGAPAADRDPPGPGRDPPLAASRARRHAERRRSSPRVRSNGFFLQDPTPDANDATSDAIFVFTDGPPAIVVGGRGSDRGGDDLTRQRAPWSSSAAAGPRART